MCEGPDQQARTKNWMAKERFGISRPTNGRIRIRGFNAGGDYEWSQSVDEQVFKDRVMAFFDLEEKKSVVGYTLADHLDVVFS